MTHVVTADPASVPAGASAVDGCPAGELQGEGGDPAGSTVPHVIGVDLSLTGTGLAAQSGVTSITTNGHKLDGLTSRHDRLKLIHAHVLDWCRTADLVVIEGPSMHSKYGSAHDRSGLWWLIVSRLLWLEIPVAEVPPANRAKYATGSGAANKERVLTETVRRFPGYEVTNNNEADALILMAMGLDVCGCPLVVMPDKHRAALAAVTWPEAVTAR